MPGLIVLAGEMLRDLLAIKVAARKQRLCTHGSHSQLCA
jgi:hypothetical protein